MNCIFCRIAAGEIPANIVYKDEYMVCFRDLNPQAPVHVLIIPRKHIVSLGETEAEDHKILGHIMEKVRTLATELGLMDGVDGGFRLVSNCGEEAGQSVLHLHFHLMGGRRFSWPPG